MIFPNLWNFAYWWSLIGDGLLDGVGPVDNRPSPDKLHKIVKKEEEKKRHVTHDM